MEIGLPYPDYYFKAGKIRPEQGKILPEPELIANYLAGLCCICTLILKNRTKNYQYSRQKYKSKYRMGNFPLFRVNAVFYSRMCCLHISVFNCLDKITFGGLFPPLYPLSRGIFFE